MFFMYKGGREDWSGEGGKDPGHHFYSQGHTLYILQKMVISKLFVDLVIRIRPVEID